MRLKSALQSMLCCAALACGGQDPAPPPMTPLETVPSLNEEASAETRSRVVLSILGTSDLHGHLERLPVLAGYVDAVRRARERDGGVVLVDAGDMWQGTLASNMVEGAPVVAAYNAMRYDAAAIGNHEFDYGPTGPTATPTEPGHERRSALLARASESTFPMLAANLLVRSSREPIQWPDVQPSVLIERAGVKVGIIGVTTAATLGTTIAANVNDLRVAPLAESIQAQATRLRAEGAVLVVVAAHAGGECTAFDDPTDLSSCQTDSEIFSVARALPRGAVDLIVSGHTHKAIAHEVEGIAILGSYALGRAFGRVDFIIEDGEVQERRIHPPQDLCEEGPPAPCRTSEYEGASVVANDAIAAGIAPALAAAEERLQERLGPTLPEALTREYREESSAGNALTDWVAAAVEGEDAVLLNAGGVRADFAAGPLTYGGLYEVFPFDNRVARVRLTAEQFAAILERNAFSSGGALLISGVRARASCEGGSLSLALLDSRGRRIPPSRMLTIVTSDYLATTSSFSALPEGAVTIEDGPPMRERLADYLRQPNTRITPANNYYNSSNRRVQLPSERPVRCPR